MTTTKPTKRLNIFAPAKLNLYLHITGRLDNGYHALDSLVSFADIGDEVYIEPAPDFNFCVQGPYAAAFNTKEIDSSPHSANLVVQAVWALARAAQKVPNIKVTLIKNLPLASGLGGGSSDAAAVIWGLCEWWELSRQAHFLPALMATLGADLPVCLNCTPARLRGIGEIIDPAPPMPEIPMLLVNPGKTCSTAQIFTHFYGDLQSEEDLPETLNSLESLSKFLETKDNVLYKPACDLVPEIENVIHAIKAQDGCQFTRMSGSGATCFGLFKTESAAQKAAKIIAQENPDWWVKAGWLNRPERY